MRLSKPWLFAAIIMVLIIWGNSLVPGSGSGSLSLSVVEAVRGALDALRLPSDWVTNFLVRKTAHFTEYAILGVLVAHAFDPEHTAEHMRLAAICLALVLVPSIDETIQLFVAGRSGQVTDVLLDCCGAATGVLLAYLVWRLRRREMPTPGDSDSFTRLTHRTTCHAGNSAEKCAARRFHSGQDALK